MSQQLVPAVEQVINATPDANGSISPPFPSCPEQLVDLAANQSGVLMRCLRRIGVAARDDERGDEGVRAVREVGEFLADWGRVIEEVPRFWVAGEPVETGGFAPCVCTPELALRLAWRVWCLVSVAVSNSVADTLSPDEGRADLHLRVEDHWPLVRRFLLRLPLGECETLAARLHIEFVKVRAEAASRLMQPALGTRPVHQEFRPCVEEFLHALEMLPRGWVSMTEGQRLQGAGGQSGKASDKKDTRRADTSADTQGEKEKNRRGPRDRGRLSLLDRAAKKAKREKRTLIAVVMEEIADGNEKKAQSELRFYRRHNRTSPGR